MPTSDTAAASSLVSSATMAGLLRCLVQKGMLKATDVRESYEMADNKELCPESSVL